MTRYKIIHALARPYQRTFGVTIVREELTYGVVFIAGRRSFVFVIFFINLIVFIFRV